MDYIHLKKHIFIHKIRQCLLIRRNTSNLSRRQEDIFRLLHFKKMFHFILTAEVKLPVRTEKQILISLPLQFPDYGGTYHTAVSGHVDFRILFHV